MSKNTEGEHIYYNALAVITGGNVALLKKLAGVFGSFFDAWQSVNVSSWAGLAKHETIVRCLDVKRTLDVENEWRRISEMNTRLVFREDAEYPEILRHICPAPMGLYVHGAIPDGDCIAVVGTRKASPQGVMACRQITEGLCGVGITVVSGLALGIDKEAHETALSSGAKTVAVIGSGIDRIYPAQNKSLASRIVAGGGALVSEYPLGVGPQKHHFPERNRIVSGLSRGVVVVEAPEKSGSLITAGLAVEQNRDVFALPGAAFDKNYSGNHQLIKEGAKLITSAQDVLDELGYESQRKDRVIDFASAEQGKIFIAVEENAEPVATDVIVRRTGLEASVVNREITFMQISGIIKELNGKFFV